MLQILTKSIFLLALQVQQLHIEKRYQLPPLDGTLCICCLHQWHTQGSTLLLDWLFTVAEEWLVDSPAWCTQDVDHEWEKNEED